MNIIFGRERVMQTIKTFATYEERIQILKDRKLKIRNEKKAVEFLQKYNYFDVINGFEAILLEKGTKNKEYKDVYFEDFKELYNFDRLLREKTATKIFDIESRIRTSISYHFAKKYCRNISETLNYCDSQYYQEPVKDKHLANKFKKFDLFTFNPKKLNDKSQRKWNKDYIKGYKNPPLWVTIKAMPLGSLYYFFIFLRKQEKEKVLKDLSFSPHQVNAYIQAIYLLKEMRNQCAHLELVTRFRLKRNSKLNNMQDLIMLANLSKSDSNYMDVLKTLKLFGSIRSIQCNILRFYIKMLFKGRKKIADKILGKMGRKSIVAWWRL